jgi:hypothetical protein
MSQPCRWCGNLHQAYCPFVKAFEFQQDGTTIKRVEFLTPMDYPPQGKVDEPEQEYPKLARKE